MRAARLPALAGPIFGVLAALAMAPAMAQTPYPDLTIQDVDWTNGTHHYAVTQRILSPSTPDLPVVISESADAEFVSAATVRLRPGFHAGDFNSSGSGRFRARIDAALGDPGDVVIISPAPDGSSPYGSIVDNVIHVHKWEKVEIGVRLPMEYKDAIERFFQHYYPYNYPPFPANGPNANVAVSNNVDPAHDLNPFADDSLQIVMRLTSPSGVQSLKWGFFMRVARWNPQATDPDLALVVAHETDPLDQYRIRFRFAPDEEGPWQFTLSVKAPHTNTLAEASLNDVLYSGYALHCEPPLEDNPGPLSVNPANGRSLWFAEQQKPFFALGTNMADIRHDGDGGAFGGWNTFHKRDFDVMQQTMEQLHEVGGNFARMWLMPNNFGVERLNIGVYDKYREFQGCDLDQLSGFTSSCQHQCWAFDQMVDHARAKNIYVELCMENGFPSGGTENVSWSNNAYVRNYIYPQERDPVTGNYDIKQQFYSYHPTTHQPLLDKGAFYFWKRRYKYVMSRWGYSVNIPIIEPFNEIDQLLAYDDRTLDELDADGICPDNYIPWPPDPDLPETVDQWHSDIIHYVRGEQDLDDPATSPMGVDKLFSINFTQGHDADTPDEDQLLPFRNPDIDMIDIHKGYGSTQGQANTPDNKMNDAFDQAKAFWEAFPQPNADVEERKPIAHGEFTHFTDLSFGGANHTIENYFHNYDISFHNELWAAAFSGKWSAGTTWKWERVFWWPDGMKSPPGDDDNLYQQEGFSNGRGATNLLDPGLGFGVPITNRRIHHHFRPLADLLALLEEQPYHLFQYDYAPRKVYDYDNQIECYYLTNGTTAIGWVHNLNAWTMNNYYLASGPYHNFLGCNPPSLQPQEITITGLFAGHNYHVNWFPTHMSTDICPADTVDEDWNNTVVLKIDNPSSAAFGGVVNNYLDTLHADFAFIITPGPLVKSLTLPAEPETPVVADGWDFTLYPNPTRGELFLSMTENMQCSVALHDLAGRTIKTWNGMTGPLIHLPFEEIAQGIYWVRVSDGLRSKAKKLIIY